MTDNEDKSYFVRRNFELHFLINDQNVIIDDVYNLLNSCIQSGFDESSISLLKSQATPIINKINKYRENKKEECI